MNNSLTLNEYEFTSKDTSWTQLPELNYGKTKQKINIHSAKVILWAVNEVKWGYYKDNIFTFSDGTHEIDLRFLQEMRIFNETEELKIVKQNNHILYRYINDQSSEALNYEYTDSTSKLIGIKVDDINVPVGFTPLLDKGRKLLQIIPFDTIKSECFLTTRNYIGYLDNYQASYIDYRYVLITDEEV